MTDTIALLYCTFADAESAARVARLVVEERLAACANLGGGIRSIYRWAGAVETADEVPVLFKTAPARAAALAARIAALHDYDLAVVESWTAHVAPAVAAWIAAETQGSAA